jgi:glycosyltransferase involved in cell wall biosynthesis
MNILVLADTFPNSLDPWRGPYNRRQIECLADLCDVTVIDPVPWVKVARDARLRSLIGKPDHTLKKITIHHPLFRYVPVLGRARHWRGILAAAKRAMPEIPNRDFDCVLATFAYPHGLAAKHLAAEMKVPYVVKVRGTDLHSLPPRGPRRTLTAEALRDASGVVAVSSNLAEIARNLGAAPERVKVITNGIDSDRFAIMPREQARYSLELPMSDRVLFSLGSLVPVKGLELLLDALAQIEESRRPMLAIGGDGPLRDTLHRRAAVLGLAGRVQLLGQVDREHVNLWMNAADALVLSSLDEGCPNVVLEAMACGTPVVATRVGAVPDLVNERCGLIAPPGDAAALSSRIEEMFDRGWDREAIRARVEGMTWRANARKLHDVLLDAVSPPDAD